MVKTVGILLLLTQFYTNIKKLCVKKKMRIYYFRFCLSMQLSVQRYPTNTWYLSWQAVLNATLNRGTEDKSWVREGGRTSEDVLLVWLRHITNTSRGYKHLGCLDSWDRVYIWNVYDSFLTTSCQRVSLIVYSGLPAFEGGGWANLTARCFSCHHSQGAMGNLCKADHTHSQTLPHMHTGAKQKRRRVHTHSQTKYISPTVHRQFSDAPATQWQSANQSNPSLLISPVKWVSARLQGRDRLTGSISHSVRQM